MKLFTPVIFDCPKNIFSYKDKIMFLGSCFASSVGEKFSDAGFDVMVNPFGPLYNPVSISNAVMRLRSAIPFTTEDCIPMGAGAGKICSFSHHTSFARDSEEAFLENANDCLSKASTFWKETSVVMITLGTAFMWQLASTGETVSNCLKRPQGEFVRKRLGPQAAASVLKALAGAFPEKRFVFTVSPIRHLGSGAHLNQLSKSTLILATDEAVSAFPGRVSYFPSFEIMMDELRDYRFYDESLTHPSAQAEGYIMERFIEWGLPSTEKETYELKMKEFLRASHRNILKG